jgi:hypothetical protein
MTSAPMSLPEQPPFISYMNFEQGIRMSYPADWINGEQPSPAGFVVFFASPQEGPGDLFRENVNLLIERTPVPMNTDQYTQACLQGMAQSPVRFLEQGPVTLDGRPAYRMVYTGPIQGANMTTLSGKYLQFLLAANSKGYVLTYTAEMQKYDKFLPLVEQIVHSLQIK